MARALAADPPILLMDEPFSAVDPVVREELQTEILRLQSELRKTIVFVTHDIDEAIKLGDKVAVFGRGGVLQQYDEPSPAAVEPGQRLRRRVRRRRPRLSRACSSATRPGFRCTTFGRVAEAEIDGLTLGPDDWVLVIKPDGTPFGWINADGVTLHRKGSSLYDSTVRRRIAVPARRHAAAGARRGVVVAVRAGRGGRRRRPAHRRGAGRRRAGGAECATAESLAETRLGRVAG